MVLGRGARSARDEVDRRHRARADAVARWGRFGFHNLRHSLASYLVTQTTTDVKTVQSMLRHADIGTTLDIYTHAINKDKLVAQNQVMEAMLKPGLVNCRGST